ncbi:ATP synthase F1 subunit epsilon [Patescibacteria group bacterium]|nr:ATP synthase F1 subunit epsilon [Patescibacteria group bacterium]
MTFHVRLVTPERIVSEYEAESLSVPTSNGEITILPHHIPLVALLTGGVLRIRHAGGIEALVVAGGFVEVSPTTHEVSVLADFAEKSSELTQHAEIEAAKKRAEIAMSKAMGADDAQVAAAAAALEREWARCRVATRRHHGHGMPLAEQGDINHDDNAS